MPLSFMAKNAVFRVIDVRIRSFHLAIIYIWASDLLMSQILCLKYIEKTNRTVTGE